MKIFSNALSGSSCLLTLLLLTACAENKTVLSVVETKVKAATTAVNETVVKSQKERDAQTEDALAIATISAPAYVAKLHRAIAFTPVHDGAGLLKPKAGNRFVVLDLSVRNLSKRNEVDMGQILLSAKITSEKGKEFRLSPMAVAAYTLDNPDPHHQVQYNALWRKLKPGDFYRTTVLGFEAPKALKTFILSMKEEGDVLKDSRWHEAKFVLD